MTRILSISSHVVRGAVGNSSIQFVLQRLGHEVWALPTVALSNHPGHTHFGGARLKPDMLRPMLEALDFNGWLHQLDSVLTGYLPSAEHVALAAEAVDLVREANGAALYLCDPAIGDDPKGLYVPQSAAETLRATLLPRADILTPNRFELEWLAARPVNEIKDAVAVAKSLEVPRVLATSIPCATLNLANVLAGEGRPIYTSVTRREQAPHGTGDIMAGLYLAEVASGCSDRSALATATAVVEAILQASAGADELRLTATQGQWSAAAPWPVKTLKDDPGIPAPERQARLS